MKKTGTEERWDNYIKANSEKPDARDNELKKIFSLINPREGEKIWELGTGNGCLTMPIAEAVGKTGEIITTDVFKGNIDSVVKKNRKLKLNIDAKLLPIDSPLLPVNPKEKFDAIVSIVTFHHFDNRKENTGEKGRVAALRRFYASLRKGGRLVLADGMDGTITQRYFDAINNPIHCYPDGHPHEFISKKRLHNLLKKIGFKDISIKIEYVPWKFESEAEGAKFVHTIHNAKCSAKESFRIAKDMLGFKKVEDKYELGWELFFLTAEK